MKVRSCFCASIILVLSIRLESTSTVQSQTAPQEISCKEINQVQNSIPSIQSGFYGDEVYYTCADGFLQTSGGTGRRVCSAIGTWQQISDDTDPVCEVTPCPHPPLVANARPTIFRIDPEMLGAVYDCSSGFEQADGGQGNRTCSENMTSGETSGTWAVSADAEDPVCVHPGSSCDEPPPVAFAYRTLTAKDVTYKCYFGYNVTSGHLHRICMNNGSYYGTSPVCTFHCGELQDLVDQTINTTSFRGGSVATVTCNSLAAANISGTVTCNVSSRMWDKSEVYCTERLAPVSAKESGSDKQDAALAIDLSRSTCTATGVSKTSYWAVFLNGSKTVYDVSSVSVVLPPDMAALIPPLEVTVLIEGGNYSFCGILYNVSATGGATLTCQKLKGRYPWGNTLNITADFSRTASGSGSLRLCDVTIHGSQHSGVVLYYPCVSPPFYEGLQKQGKFVPLISNANFMYTCADGRSAVAGSRFLGCDIFGEWSKPSLVCADRENLALGQLATSNTNLRTRLLTDEKLYTAPKECDNITSWSLRFQQDLRVDAVALDILHEFSRTAMIAVRVRVTGAKSTESLCAEEDVQLQEMTPKVFWMTTEVATATVTCLHPVFGSSIQIEFAEAPCEIHEIRVFGRKHARTMPPTECVESQSLEGYLGRINITRNGYTCQRWDQQYPHSHPYTTADYFPDLTLEDAANFCRNPNGSRSFIWCYVDAVDTEWDYCPGLVCDKHCILDSDGRYYFGKESVTAAGQLCLPWDTPGLPFSGDVDFQHGKGALCRNPGGSQTAPWCYTSVKPLSYGHCNIPQCPNVLNITVDQPSVWTSAAQCVSHDEEWLEQEAFLLYRQELCDRLTGSGLSPFLFCRVDQQFILLALNCYSASTVTAVPVLTTGDTTVKNVTDMKTTGAFDASTHQTHVSIFTTARTPLKTHLFCACACNRTAPRLTLTEPAVISREVRVLQGPLVVEKMALSANVRKKTSVRDDRVSVAATGCLFLAMLLSLLVFFIASDVVSVVVFLLKFLSRKRPS